MFTKGFYKNMEFYKNMFSNDGLRKKCFTPNRLKSLEKCLQHLRKKRFTNKVSMF